MHSFAGRLGLAAAPVLAVVALLAGAGRERAATRPERKAALTSSGNTRVAPARGYSSTILHLPSPVAGDRGAILIDVDGVITGSLDAADLADRPTALHAIDRRAWRLTELLDNTHISSNAVIHALTIDGGDYILSDDGRDAGVPIVVRRGTGELYIGWLAPSTSGKQLTDAELPAERIERVARISITSPIAERDEPPATLAIIIDGHPHHTLTPESFATTATLQIRGVREGTAPALDLAHAFGATLQVAAVTANGARLTATPPHRDAHAVIYLDRRARFRFAWVDPTGEPINGTRQREVTELALETPRLATGH